MKKKTVAQLEQDLANALHLGKLLRAELSFARPWPLAEAAAKDRYRRASVLDRVSSEKMRIDFPDHPIGPWLRTPLWMFWRPTWRRRHWRWTVDYCGCECTYYWQYGDAINVVAGWMEEAKEIGDDGRTKTVA